jgi:hypothetical protein
MVLTVDGGQVPTVQRRREEKGKEPNVLNGKGNGMRKRSRRSKVRVSEEELQSSRLRFTAQKWISFEVVE